MKKIIIAIDGYSSTGKSTIAKELAKNLKYTYVDTGAMYRAVTLYALKNNLIGNGFIKEEALIKNLQNIRLSFHFNAELGFSEIYLNNTNVENQIRTIQISNFVSLIAAIPEVRKKLVTEQQELGKAKGIVMDGRDIGTVVFPDAELKIFMTASAKERTARRHLELNNKGEQVTFEQVYNNIVTRDRIDTTRKDSPLQKAKDAIEFDNTNFTVEEQLQKILNILENQKEVLS